MKKIVGSLDLLKLPVTTKIDEARKSFRSVLAGHEHKATCFCRKCKCDFFPGQSLICYFSDLLHPESKPCCNSCTSNYPSWGAFKCGTLLCKSCVVPQEGAAATSCPEHGCRGSTPLLSGSNFALTFPNFSSFQHHFQFQPSESSVFFVTKFWKKFIYFMFGS